MPMTVASHDDIAEIKTQLGDISAQLAALSRNVESNKRAALSEWMTVREVAEYLNVTEQTIRRRVRRGGFVSQKPGGGKILVLRESVFR